MEVNSKGYTLIELLVVIAIIGMLASTVLMALNDARQQASINTSISQVRNLEKAILMYAIDTGRYPPTCDVLCTLDPLSTNPGVAGWDGPYFSVDLLTFAHPWGGHYSIESGLNSSGRTVAFVTWNDDAPQTSHADNSGPLPVDVILAIDKILDDGSTSTGKARSTVLAPGEIRYELKI